MSEIAKQATETEAISACSAALEHVEPEAAARVVAYLQMRFGGAPIQQERPLFAESGALKKWDERNRAYAKVIDGTTTGQLLMKNSRLWGIVGAMLPHMPPDVKTSVEADLQFEQWEDFVRENEYELAAAKKEAERTQEAFAAPTEPAP